MISQLSPEAACAAVALGQKIVDVRSPAEFAIGHIPGAINVPMEQVEMRMADIGNGPVLLACEAGKRAEIVAGWFEGRQPVSVIAGGTAAWRKAGLPLVRCAPCRWTLERQVRLGAGIIVLLGSLLALLADRRWTYLALFVGGGLTFAGVTNICGMEVLLARMPWNRERKSSATCITTASAQCRS